MDLGLSGKVVVVTGASRGLGAAMALALAKEGAQVVAAARSAGDLRDVATQGGANVSAEIVDMSETESISLLTPRVLERYGRIDALINNAGIAPAGTFVDQDPELWSHVMQVNVIGPMQLAQAVGAHMIARRGGGRIVNVASTTGLRGKPLLAAYSASKGAMVRLTEALAAEWARDEVLVNCLAPGAFRTEAQRAVLDSDVLHEKRRARIPLRRIAEPSELVPMACLLVSPMTTFTTGATIVVDGGEAAKL